MFLSLLDMGRSMPGLGTRSARPACTWRLLRAPGAGAGLSGLAGQPQPQSVGCARWSRPSQATFRLTQPARRAATARLQESARAGPDSACWPAASWPRQERAEARSPAGLRALTGRSCMPVKVAMVAVSVTCLRWLRLGHRFSQLPAGRAAKTSSSRQAFCELAAADN